MAKNTKKTTSGMNVLKARTVLKEYTKRFGDLPPIAQNTSHTERSTQFFKDCFQHQIDFIADPSKLKTALCSRRAGKTHAAAVYLLKEMVEYPGSEAAYIALTRSNAKRVMWPKLKQLSHQNSLGLHFNNSELFCTFPNGSVIYLTGANDSADVDKLRGSAFRLVVLDECASFGRHMDELVEEALEPTLIDCDGTLCMIGTPNAHCSGIFFRMTTMEDSDYSNHAWTIMENPHIPHAKDWLDQRMTRRGWDSDHPVFMREWCGKWVRSADSLVYRISEDKNIYETLPVNDFDFEYILGVDLGFEDATAFTVVAFSRDLPFLYLIDEFKASHMIPTEIAQHIRELTNVYEFIKIVVDTGGLGKSIAEEFRIRYQLPITPASKYDKFAYIELLNSDLASGFIKLPRGSGLEDEWRLLQWDEKRQKESERCENHLSDAFLYAWRESRHYCSEELVRAPKYGTNQWFTDECAKMEEEELQRLEKVDDPDDWWETENLQ